LVVDEAFVLDEPLLLLEAPLLELRLPELRFVDLRPVELRLVERVFA